MHLAGVKVYEEGEVRSGPEPPLVGFLVNLSYKRRLFEVLLDVVLIVLAYYAAHTLSPWADRSTSRTGNPSWTPCRCW